MKKLILLVALFVISFCGVQASYVKPAQPSELSPQIINAVNPLLDKIYSLKSNFQTTQEYVNYLENVNVKLKSLRDTFSPNNLKYILVNYIVNGVDNIKKDASQDDLTSIINSLNQIITTPTTKNYSNNTNTTTTNTTTNISNNNSSNNYNVSTPTVRTPTPTTPTTSTVSNNTQNALVCMVGYVVDSTGKNCIDKNRVGEINREKYHTKNLSITFNGYGEVAGIKFFDSDGVNLTMVGFDAYRILLTLDRFNIDKSQLAELADILDRNGVKYRPYELYKGSNHGIDLRDLATGGMGTAYDWTVDPLCEGKGPSACSQIEEARKYAESKGITKKW